MHGMNGKSKEKRKGRPRRNWRIILLCLALVGLLGLYLYSQIVTPDYPPSTPILTSFDINEEMDEIALSWWDSSNRMGIWGTRKWSDVQRGMKITNFLGEQPINSLG